MLPPVNASLWEAVPSVTIPPWRSWRATIVFTVPAARKPPATRSEVMAVNDFKLASVVTSPMLTTPWQAPAKRPSNLVWYVYLVETDRRDELVTFLTERGVGTEVYYPRPLTEQPCLRDLPGACHPAPVAKRASRRAVALPLYADLTDAQVDQVCDLVHEFHGGVR